jgi:predicted peptidase
VTGLRREYFVYLPADYEQFPDKKWPVMLFLHGNGERGDGLADLDYVLRHGPLMEAWIQRRKLPFIIISPQLPLFGELEAVAGRASETRPERLAEGTPQRNYGFPSDLPIQRTNADSLPAGWYSSYDLPV